MSAALYVIKVGSTYPAVAARFGDFESWIADRLALAEVQTHVIDAQSGAELPPAVECDGIVVTGSHSMITDDPRGA